MIDYETRVADAMGIFTEGRRRLKAMAEPDGQKFHIGQRVHIAKDLGETMIYFNSDVDATVVGVYSHMYGGDDVESYSLNIDGIGESAWYQEWQLTAIEE